MILGGRHIFRSCLIWVRNRLECPWIGLTITQAIPKKIVGGPQHLSKIQTVAPFRQKTFLLLATQIGHTSHMVCVTCAIVEGIANERGSKKMRWPSIFRRDFPASAQRLAASDPTLQDTKTSPKYCINCTHFRADEVRHYSKCRRPVPLVIDPVFGPRKAVVYADLERGNIDGCGPDAIYWESK